MLSFLAAQIAALGMLVALGLAGAYGRPALPRRAPPGAARSHAGPFALAVEVAWLGLIAFALVYPLAILIDPGDALGGAYTFSFPGAEVVELFGVAVFGLGTVLLGWSFRALGRFATPRLEVRSDHVIVRSGPYARLRHPMYTAVILLTSGVALAFLSRPVALAALAIVALAGWRAKSEESLFLESPTLGDEYARYAARTGRFLPRWRVGPAPPTDPRASEDPGAGT
jgi:protein-S-isoprenylcysteine O-methyltransferase Ste14